MHSDNDSRFQPVTWTDIGGIVHVDGLPALDAKGRQLKVRLTDTVSCQRCGSRCLSRPLIVTSEYRPSLGRVCYFHCLADGLSRSDICDDCRAKGSR